MEAVKRFVLWLPFVNSLIASGTCTPALVILQLKGLTKKYKGKAIILFLYFSPNPQHLRATLLNFIGNLNKLYRVTRLCELRTRRL